MTWLIRLFPRDWRSRYGEEFAAVLDATPLTPAFLADVVAAAGRARGRSAAATVDRWVTAPLRSDRGRRYAAELALVAGLIWSVTFVTGGVVDWGRNGRDWGFLLLLGAAIVLLPAVLSITAESTGVSRYVSAIGSAIHAAGGVLLVVALLAAMILERPLAIRLPASPLDCWEAGMLLVTLGAAISLTALIGGPPLAATGAALAIVASLPLMLSLIRPTRDPVFQVTESLNGGGAVSASLSVPDHGWFVTDPIVLVGGLAFGVAWILVGWSRMHARVGHEAIVDGGVIDG